MLTNHPYIEVREWFPVPQTARSLYLPCMWRRSGGTFTPICCIRCFRYVSFYTFTDGAADALWYELITGQLPLLGLTRVLHPLQTALQDLQSFSCFLVISLGAPAGQYAIQGQQAPRLPGPCRRWAVPPATGNAVLECFLCCTALAAWRHAESTGCNM